ncbi:MAG TPA: hypothetical protein VHT21_11185 [Stellaceae bacterium]|nr:hypothetical protein [Stellaceae bacterium]
MVHELEKHAIAERPYARGVTLPAQSAGLRGAPGAAQRALRAMPTRDRQRIIRALDDMKTDPLTGDITALRGEYRGPTGVASARGALFSD